MPVAGVKNHTINDSRKRFDKRTKTINKETMSMFKRIITFALLLTLLFSCSDLDPQPVKEPYEKQTAELNEKYFDKVCGEWSNSEEKDLSRRYEYLRLTSDEKCTYTRKLVKREKVLIDGEEKLTDWQTAYEDTGYGTWKLGYSDFSGDAMPYLKVMTEDAEGHTSVNAYFEFNGADDEFLYVRCSFFDRLKRVVAEQ